MRVVKCAGLAVAALLLASIASAQGIGDVAAREKEKRKGPKPAKVYTESDLGSASSALPAPVVEAAAPADAAKPGEAKPADKDAEKAAAEAAAKAQAEWRQKLDKARQEEAAYQSTIDRLQAMLNDTSYMYSPGWTQAMAKLDETKQQLVQVRDQIAALQAEGQRAGYR